MSAELAQAAAEVAKPDVVAALGINLKLFIAQLINVAVVLLVLGLWVFKPLGVVLEKRRKKIEDGLKHAAQAEKTLHAAKEQQENLLAEARVEARGIIESGRASGEKERTVKVEQAKRDVEAQVDEAKARIQTERMHALDAARKEVAGLVIAATRKVTAGTLDADAHRASIQEAITELENAKV